MDIVCRAQMSGRIDVNSINVLAFVKFILIAVDNLHMSIDSEVFVVRLGLVPEPLLQGRLRLLEGAVQLVEEVPGVRPPSLGVEALGPVLVELQLRGGSLPKEEVNFPRFRGAHRFSLALRLDDFVVQVLPDSLEVYLLRLPSFTLLRFLVDN